MDRDQLKQVSRAVGLELSAGRVEMLQETYSRFSQGFARVRQIDVGDREPPTLVPSQDKA